MIGQIPAILTPTKLQELLGIKSPQSLAKIPVIRRPLFKGSSKYIYLAEDVIAYLKKQNSPEVDIDFDV